MQALIRLWTVGKTRGVDTQDPRGICSILFFIMALQALLRLCTINTSADVTPSGKMQRSYL